MAKRSCPGCGSREPIDLHSCKAERVLRKQRQQFQFQWPDVEGDLNPAPRAKVKGGMTAPLKIPSVQTHCGKCAACSAGMEDLCEVELKRLME